MEHETANFKKVRGILDDVCTCKLHTRFYTWNLSIEFRFEGFSCCDIVELWYVNVAEHKMEHETANFKKIKDIVDDVYV